MKKTTIPVEVMAHFDITGRLTPYRIRYEKDDIKVIKISKVIKRRLDMHAGNPIAVYECISQNEGQETFFVLKYEKKYNRWFLTKI